MVKKIFIFLVVIILVGIAAWFFVEKTKTVSDKTNLEGLADDGAKISPSADGEKEGDWVKSPSGLEYQDVVIGTGREAKEGNFVSAHYAGTLTDGTKFDSSYERGQPFSFILGGGMVIKGWDEGLVGMKVGGKRKLIIPPNLGYGAVTNGPIPENSTLLFDVELMGVFDSPPIE